MLVEFICLFFFVNFSCSDVVEVISTTIFKVTPNDKHRKLFALVFVFANAKKWHWRFLLPRTCLRVCAVDQIDVRLKNERIVKRMARVSYRFNRITMNYIYSSLRRIVTPYVLLRLNARCIQIVQHFYGCHTT